ARETFAVDQHPIADEDDRPLPCGHCAQSLAGVRLMNGVAPLPSMYCGRTPFHFCTASHCTSLAFCSSACSSICLVRFCSSIAFCCAITFCSTDCSNSCV